MIFIRSLFIYTCVVLCNSFCGLGLYGAEDIWPEWPTASSFSPGQSIQFRLPFFKNYFTYPNNEPLYYELYLPRGFDANRSYPLCIQFQGQNSPPSHWMMQQMTEDAAIVLGVSWSMSAPLENDQLKLRDTGMYHTTACVHWLRTQFKIDLNRIIVGGFSAGGWSASSQAMRPEYRNISTHFLITGAGTRGQPVFDLFKGKSVFLAAGTQDMNYDWAQKAKAVLSNAGFNVTYFEEPGVAHAVGPLMKIEMQKWFKTFDPMLNAQKNYDEALAILGSKKPDLDAACALLADVAYLGDKQPLAQQARQKLEELEGEALAQVEMAYEVLGQRKYGLAQALFKEAGKLAKKQKSVRLFTLCQRGMVEIGEWQFTEQVTLLDQCEFTDRPYQAYLLCQDGVKRLGGVMEDFGGQIFKNNYDWYEGIMKKMKKPTKERLKAQKSLLDLRLSIWSGKAVKDEKSISATHEELQAIAAELSPDDPEQREIKELEAQLPELKQLSLFGM